jgi:hypothetical protein
MRKIAIAAILALVLTLSGVVTAGMVAQWDSAKDYQTQGTDYTIKANGIAQMNIVSPYGFFFNASLTKGKAFDFLMIAASDYAAFSDGKNVTPLVYVQGITTYNDTKFAYPSVYLFFINPTSDAIIVHATIATYSADSAYKP